MEALLDKNLIISVLECQWFAKNPNQDLLQKHLNNTPGLPMVAAKLLAAKNISLQEAQEFLNPGPELLPDPMHLIDMPKAALALVEAIQQNKKMALISDYDVDGTTSAALLKKYLQAIGQDIFIYIPDRIKEGYGPNCEAFRSLKNQQKIDLCFTLDCGTVANKAIETASTLGMQIIVIDHHISTETIPPAFAVVNPNRYDETSPYTYLSAAGLTFLYLMAVQSILEQQNFFLTNPKPDLMEWLDLVALSTVCDIVPLIGLNRFFVRAGLHQINAQKNIGLKALTSSCKTIFPASERDLGFTIGPRINACGRLASGELAVKLLTSADPVEADKLSQDTAHLNKARKLLDKATFEEIAAQIAPLAPALNIIIVASKNWHPGVIGIAASKVKDKFNLPAAIIAIDTNGIGKASMRGTENMNCGEMVLEAKALGLLREGGGHKAAAGFSVEVHKIAALQEFFDKYLAEHSTYDRQDIRKKYFDLSLSSAELNLETLEAINMLAPFGRQNEEPVVLLESVLIEKIETFQYSHIALIVAKDNVQLKAIMFNAYNSPLHLAVKPGEKADLIGTLIINRWNNHVNINLNVCDIVVNKPTAVNNSTQSTISSVPSSA